MAGDLKKANAEQVLNGFIDTVTETLKSGKEITLVGFGTFKVQERQARTGRNPKTGEPLQIEASKTPVFKPGKTLKDAIKGE